MKFIAVHHSHSFDLLMCFLEQGGKGQSASVCARKTAFILGHPQRVPARWPRVSYTRARAPNTQILALSSILYTANPCDCVMRKQSASSMLLNSLCNLNCEKFTSCNPQGQVVSLLSVCSVAGLGVCITNLTPLTNPSHLG